MYLPVFFWHFVPQNSPSVMRTNVTIVPPWGTDGRFGRGVRAGLVLWLCHVQGSHWGAYFPSLTEQSSGIFSSEQERVDSLSRCSVSPNLSTTHCAVSRASGSWSQHSVMVEHTIWMPWRGVKKIEPLVLMGVLLT